VLRLTPRDRQLCKLLCRGYEQADMAKELGISPRTVKARFQKMYDRNGITDGVRRVKLAVLFYREEHGGT
jgi:DNA-binding NarL/FixJ family response regulator